MTSGRSGARAGNRPHPGEEKRLCRVVGSSSCLRVCEVSFALAPAAGWGHRRQAERRVHRDRQSDSL